MDSDLRARLARIACAFPEAERDATHGGHDAYAVRGKKFAYFLDNHHGDGRTAVTVRCPPGEHTRLIESDPVRFFMPAYLGPRGWVGLRLDLARVDWDEVERLVLDSYVLQAPKRLAALVRS